MVKVRRVRKAQQELFVSATGKVTKAHGGKRAGAGRPITPGRARASERHLRRTRIRASQPVHVTVRCVPEVKGLRKHLCYLAIRAATLTSAARGDTGDFRIVHLSIQGNHLHLIVEARDWLTLSRGMQGFQISAARRLNRALGRKGGKVFADRYHTTVLETPRQVRNTLAYVLNNWRRHGVDRHGAARRRAVDPYSSGASFEGWREPVGGSAMANALVVWAPKTWLLGDGWRRHGLISPWEVPRARSPSQGPAASARRVQ